MIGGVDIWIVGAVDAAAEEQDEEGAIAESGIATVVSGSCCCDP